MKVTVRSATSRDANSIAHVIYHARRAHLPFVPLIHTEAEMRIWVDRVLIPVENVLVAVDDENVVGIISTADTDGVTWVNQLYVDPSMVSRRIGTTLLDSTLRSVRTAVKLYTFQANAGARRFYQRHGFVETEYSDGSATDEKCPDVLLVRAPVL